MKKREKEAEATSLASGGSGSSPVPSEPSPGPPPAPPPPLPPSSSLNNNNCAKILKKTTQRQPCRFRANLGLSDDQIYYYLRSYTVDQDTLRSLGFPLESQLSPGKAWVYQDPEFRGSSFVCDDEPTKSISSSSLDVNAREFIPKRIAEDEAAASGDEVASTHSNSSLSASAKEFVPSKTNYEDFAADFEKRICARCSHNFYVFRDTGEVVKPETCVYHWGKPHKSRKYSCCGRKAKTQTGCDSAPSHVWRGVLNEVSGLHKDLEGYAKTRPPRNRAQPADGNYGVYGIDGEMLFTTQGLQLCKITVVGVNGRLVYETFVHPEDPIVDFNTRFSGVSAKDLKRGPAKCLRDVQNDLLGFINANTILIGHGLENDLRALKLVHMTVIDTSLVFPHFYGLPYRRSLKSVVQIYLDREIQAENSGHDSYEDARACVELMLWKVCQDLESSSRFSSGPASVVAAATPAPVPANPGAGHQYSPFPPPQQQQPPEQ